MGRHSIDYEPETLNQAVPVAPAPVADTPSEAGMLHAIPASSTLTGTQLTGGLHARRVRRMPAAILASLAMVAGVAAVGTATAPAGSSELASLGASRAAVAERPSGTVTLAVRVDGEVRSLETNALTVGDALAEAGIVVGEADRVSVSLASPVIEGSEVSIVRVEVRTVTEEKAQAFESVREDDASLAKGTEKVATEGVDGLVRETYEVTFEDGQEVGRELVLSTQVREKVDEVIKVGTKEEVDDSASAADSAASAPAASVNQAQVQAQAQADAANQQALASSASANAQALPTGAHLTRSSGTFMGPSGKETYYNLPMSGVVSIARNAGIPGEYWVRSDGVKMYGDYIMAACSFAIRPRGSLVATSLGTAMCLDTGGFAAGNPTQIDIAVTW